MEDILSNEYCDFILLALVLWVLWDAYLYYETPPRLFGLLSSLSLLLIAAAAVMKYSVCHCIWLISDIN